MNDHLKVAVFGAFLYGAVYLTGCFVAGFLTGNVSAWTFALASAGVAYIAQYLEALAVMGVINPRIPLFTVAASATLGLFAGLFLIF